MKPTYQSNNKDFNLFLGNCIDSLQSLKDSSFDMVFADPPYFLSNGGISLQNGRIVCVDKGNWDKLESVDNIDSFNMQWLSLCHKKLKNNGTIWITGTYHNIFSIAKCITELGYKILNVVTWQKTSPPPSITQRTLTFSSELVIWARKTKRIAHKFNADMMRNINNGKQLTDVWPMPTVEKWEKQCGKHPTQKPLGLLGRIILASTDEKDWILDPFNGSGSTGIAASLLRRNYVGIEMDEQFVKLSIIRRKQLDGAKERRSMFERLMKSIQTNYELKKIKNNMLISRIGSQEQLGMIKSGWYNVPYKSIKELDDFADIEYLLLFEKGRHGKLHLYKRAMNTRLKVMTKDEVGVLSQSAGVNYKPHRSNSYICIKLTSEILNKKVQNKYLDVSKFLLPYEIKAPFWLKSYDILDKIIISK